MQYLVSAENSGHFYWQLEILIESFLMNDMQDDLVVCLAEEDSTARGMDPVNLMKHPHIVFHKNLGRERNCPPLNTLAAIKSALDSGALKFPFTLIHPDMILLRPIEPPQDEGIGVVVNNFNEYPDDDRAENEIKSRLNLLGGRYQIDANEFRFVPFFGWPIVFNKPSEEHLEAMLYTAVGVEEELSENMGADFPCERVAWTVALAEVSVRTGVVGRFMSGPILFDHDNMNLIHYSKGIPPDFHKKHYDYKSHFHLSGLDPIDALAASGATVNCDHARKVIESYRSKMHTL